MSLGIDIRLNASLNTSLNTSLGSTISGSHGGDPLMDTEGREVEGESKTEQQTSKFTHIGFQQGFTSLTLLFAPGVQKRLSPSNILKKKDQDIVDYR